MPTIEQEPEQDPGQPPESSKLEGNIELVVIPVRNMVLFPGVVLPLMIGRQPSILAVQAATAENRPVGLLLQRDEHLDEPGPDDLYSVGSVATIVRYWTAPDGRNHAICQGGARFKVLKYLQREPFLRALVEVLEPDERETRAIEGRFVALKQRALEVLDLAPGAPEEMAQAVAAIDSPAVLADMVATFVDVPAAEKQELLEIFDLRKRLDRLNQMLGEWAAVLELSQKIRMETSGTLEKAQREYYLREQLRTIQKELGDEDGSARELAELSE